MSPYSLLRSSAFLATKLAIGCIVVGCTGSASLSTISVVPSDEIAQLPTECQPLGNFADEDLMWARAEDDDAAIVLDTPDGTCVARREAVLATLSDQKRDDLVAHISRDFAAADPSPHPDIPGGMTTGADPSPHPDKPQGTTSVDPSPHPDKDDGDDGDDMYTIVVVVDVVIGTGPSGGSEGTPPPPPTPKKPE